MLIRNVPKIIYYYEVQMSLNVPGKRRFCGCDEGIAKQFQQPQKCDGAKMHKGRSPTAFLRSPSPEGAKRLPFVKRRVATCPVILQHGTIYTIIVNAILIPCCYHNSMCYCLNVNVGSI